jgi:hypothetical protein
MDMLCNILYIKDRNNFVSIMSSTAEGPTGTSSSTAQPTSTPTELGGNYKCLSCDTSFDSKELLQEHNQQAHGKKTTTVP